MPARPENVSPRAPQASPEPGHLGEAARDERRLGVVAEPEAVDAAGRERHHVLRRRAELDPDEVGVEVDAEARRDDRVLELDRERLVLARDHGGGGKALRDLLRVVRAREHRDGPAARRPSRAASPSPDRAPSSG